MKRALALALLVLPLHPAGAQQSPNYTNFPDELAIASGVVMQGTDQLQNTAVFQYFKNEDSKDYAIAAEFEYGLTDRWEIDAGAPYEFIDRKNAKSVNGIGDVEAAMRYGIVKVQTNSPFALTAGLGIGIPTGDRRRDLGEGRLTVEPSFTASTWVGRFNAELNCGWRRAVTDAGEEPRGEFEYNVAVIYPVDRWFLAVEGDGSSTTRTTTYYITPEVIYKLTEKLQVLVGVPVGVTHASADYGIIASVTLELDNLTGRGSDKD